MSSQMSAVGNIDGAEYEASGSNALGVFDVHSSTENVYRSPPRDRLRWGAWAPAARPRGVGQGLQTHPQRGKASARGTSDQAAGPTWTTGIGLSGRRLSSRGLSEQDRQYLEARPKGIRAQRLFTDILKKSDRHYFKDFSISQREACKSRRYRNPVMQEHDRLDLNIGDDRQITTLKEWRSRGSR